MSKHKFHKAVDNITANLVDKGLLIEAGFASYIHACFGGPDKIPVEQLKELRQAFFGGSQHLFGSIMSFLDGGDEPTDKDLSRIDRIDQELKKFISEFARDHIPTRGSA